jgi:glycosyltransferase involved in cell wall biosynthesis
VKLNRLRTNTVTISVVTAVHDCSEQLPQLIASLRAQTDADFEWVVADGASSDGTIEILQAVADLNLVMSSQPDFGIYDALNRALRIAKGSYYIVVGADDRLFPDAIANFRDAIVKSNADVISAYAMFGGRRVGVRGGPVWLHGAHSYIGNHSLSSAFRTDLHRSHGYYSRRFPIAADALFVIQVCKGGAQRYEAEFIAGEMGRYGVSAVDWAGSATEFFRVQLATGCSVSMQIVLLLLRLLKGASPRVRTLAEVLRQRM